MSKAPGTSLPEQVLEIIQLGDAATAKAAALEKAAADRKAQIEALIPKVAAALIENDRVRVDQADGLRSALRDPVQTLQLLEKLAAHRTPEELQRLGEAGADPTRAKAASQRSSGYVGAQSSQPRASDAQFFQRIMGYAPQS